MVSTMHGEISGYMMRETWSFLRNERCFVEKKIDNFKIACIFGLFLLKKKKKKKPYIYSIRRPRYR
jgi:hypothetical protein